MQIKNTLPLTVAFLTIASFPAHAATEYFHEKCPTIPQCVDFVSNLLGQKYIYEEELSNRKIQSTKNIEISKENAELLLTNALYQNGFSRVPLGQSNTYQIVSLKETPKQAVPTFTGDATHKPELPKVWDVVTLKYKTSNPRSAQYMVRLLQDFIPRTGEIMGTDAGYLIVTAAAPELARIVSLIDAFDQKLSSAALKKLEAHKGS